MSRFEDYRPGKLLKVKYEVWKKLKDMKNEELPTFDDVLYEILSIHPKGQVRIEGDIRTELPKLKNRVVPTKDKVLNLDLPVHDFLKDLKMQYTYLTGLPSRGPDAVTLEHILIELIRQYEEWKEKARSTETEIEADEVDQDEVKDDKKEMTKGGSDPSSAKPAEDAGGKNSPKLS